MRLDTSYSIVRAVLAPCIACGGRQVQHVAREGVLAGWQAVLNSVSLRLICLCCSQRCGRCCSRRDCRRRRPCSQTSSSASACQLRLLDKHKC